MKVISGGQTGVDRAALDAAILYGIDYGGAIPKGRLAEDGPISRKYKKLQEMPAGTYRQRTRRNVEDADATLIFTWGPPSNGTAYTIQCARRAQKPSLRIDLVGRDRASVVHDILDWVEQTHPKILNIAGPRESKSPGIYTQVRQILTEVFKVLASEL